MAADLRAQRPRCEYLENPLGLDETSPRFSWVLASQRCGARQSAWAILVASSQERLASGVGDCWESGVRQGANSTQIVYAGVPLESGRRYWWQARVWDGDGEEGTPSEPAWFEMGLLHRSDWQAQWIGVDVVRDGALLPVFQLRKEFILRDRPVRARLYATARGVYQAQINGARVGDTRLAPGWTDYDKRIQYQTYDVTSLLSEGCNALGFYLGEGWYSGSIGFERPPLGEQNRHYGAVPQLLAQLRVEYAGGARETIVTDLGWCGGTGAIRSSDLLMGEEYDARLEQPGWDHAGFDAAGRQPVAAGVFDDALLVCDRAQPVRILHERRPVAITQPAPGSFVFDMGQNMVGVARLRVRAAAGTTVRLRFGEALSPDGTLYTANLRAAQQTDLYTCSGREEEECFEPLFTFHGFRYVEVSGYPGTPDLETITGCVMHSDTPPVGAFTSSSALMNRLHENILWSQRGNFLSIPTDCPQRDERLGWTADAQIFVRTASYNMDVAAFMTKYMADMVDAQLSSGAFTDVAPRLIVQNEGAPAWGDAGVIIPWTLWRVYGDTRIIERNWEAMRRWMTYLERTSFGHKRTGRLGSNYSDWLSIHARTPGEIVGTAYYAWDAHLMAQMARAIGRESEAAAFEELFAGIKRAFNAAWVQADGSIHGGTQTCYVLALQMNLLDEALRPKALAHLVADIEAHGGHLTTGFVGVGYLLPVLTRFGRLDVAYSLLNKESFPSWGYSIRHGATTIWERWDGWTEEKGFQNPRTNSFNHYSLGSVGEWLYRFVAGIELDDAEPGFARVRFQPHPGGGLTHAGARLETMHGAVSTAWRVAGACFEAEIAIPANTTAVVRLPTADWDSVLLDSAPIDQTCGEPTEMSIEGGGCEMTLPSGRWSLSCTLAGPYLLANGEGNGEGR